MRSAKRACVDHNDATASNFVIPTALNSEAGQAGMTANQICALTIAQYTVDWINT